MSTIKSSDEHLTLNADGSSKDIKLQSNASEKVIIKSDGNVGIGTSSPSAVLETKNTTDGSTFAFQATNDNDHEIVQIGAQSDGDGYLTVHGQGATTNIKALIHSDGNSYFDGGNVGIGTTSPARKLHLKDTGFCALAVDGNASANSAGVLFYQNGVEKGHIIWDNTDNALQISGQASNETDLLKITSDGRGLSQFTAKVWCSYDLSGTASFFDSHNCSSLTDNGTGDTTINFTNNMANTNYAIAGMSNDPGYIIALRDWTYVYVGSIRLATTNSSGSLLDARRAMIVLFGD